MNKKTILFVGDLSTERGYIECMALAQFAKRQTRKKIRVMSELEVAIAEMTNVELVVKTTANRDLCDVSAATCRVAFALNVPVTSYNRFLNIPKETFAQKLDRWLEPFFSNPMKVEAKGGTV